MAKRKKKANRALNRMLHLGIYILIVLLTAYVFVTYIGQRVVVHSVSMQPTFAEGEVLFVDKLTCRFVDPKRFSVLCFHSDSEQEDLIKRVIGLPNETVRIKDGVIYINGGELKDYKGLEAPEFAGTAEDEIVLGDDEYFVLGDNRKESIDSRYHQIGTVSRADIIGIARVRMKPVSKFQFL